MIIGSRAAVFHGNAEKTSGGLRKSDLKLNKGGEIVSKKSSALAKKSEPEALKKWRKSVKKVSAEPRFEGKFNLLKKGTPFYRAVKKDFDSKK